MPKRTDLSSIAIIGAGPIVIGQACEFDYSGAQACKALRAEGYRVVLINSNPATIMTDPDTADATYVEPITPEFVTRVLEIEKPDALLPTMGGQTALNTAITLANSGTLDRLGVELIGAKPEVIAKAEDRQLFREAMDSIGLESPKSILVSNMEEARDALQKIGLPTIIRPSFTLGGAGGGIAYNHAGFEEIVSGGLRASPVGQVLIEESVLGWKEFEMEVVRDNADNCIIVCSIENIDPMGIHTGDSMTVAPSLTLTDKEYQRMRDASIAVLREVGVDTGGSNVQFAVNPATGRQVVIEMNPRVSRSSALASKATGFPIAKIAAKLAVGYTLDELGNDITKVTPASFEPTIDYVVTKIPRFAFEKFPGAEASLTTSMKSVGEAMAIGRTFPESLQKALRSLETGLDGLGEIALPDVGDPPDLGALRAALSQPRPDRLLIVGQAFRAGLSVEDIFECCRIDPWFLRQIEEIVAVETEIRETGLPSDYQGWLTVKRLGFSDARLAALSGIDESEVRESRTGVGVTAVFKRIDTCAAEFASETPYLYSTFEGDLFDPEAGGECEAEPTDREKIIILGGGPNRIGQGIEFDYCCVHAAFSLSDAGYETIMVNCNPETVSTDYDTSDRLYFEPLTVETVTALYRTEMKKGTVKGLIVQFGGQTPLNLASKLEAAGLPILGTSIASIDRAEDREEFADVLRQTGLEQPANGIARTVDEAAERASEIGYPVLLRPSFVLGGRAMEIVHDEPALRRYMANAVAALGNNPVLIDSYLRDATEVDVDAICDGEAVYVAGIMEHIEEAGIHSGDSACALPPQSLSPEIVAALKKQATKLALALNVIGLINVQFAVKDDKIYVIEANPRASRTVPFVAKATSIPIAKIAARVMAGEKLANFELTEESPPHVSVKEAVFPFNKFPGVDVILGPEMRSTGEVMGIDATFERAFAKAIMGAGSKIPSEGCVFVSVKDSDKDAIIDPARRLTELGYSLVATRGTAKHLGEQGIRVDTVNKVMEGRPHVVDSMIDGRIQIVINTTEGPQAVRDSFELRRTALMNGIMFFTTLRGAVAAVEAIASLKDGQLEVEPLQSYSKWLSRH